MVHVPHIRYMYHAPDKSCSGFFCLPGYCSYLDFASLLPLLSLKDPSVCTVEANNQKSPSSFRQCCSSTSMLFKLLNSMFLPSMSFIGDAFMLFKPFKKWFRNEKRDQGSPQTDRWQSSSIRASKGSKWKGQRGSQWPRPRPSCLALLPPPSPTLHLLLHPPSLLLHPLLLMATLLFRWGRWLQCMHPATKLNCLVLYR